VQHSLEVTRKSLEIASRVKIPVNRQLLARGAIFHDLGKARTYGMENGEIGAKIAEKLEKYGKNPITLQRKSRAGWPDAHPPGASPFRGRLLPP
jgi:putative nucleotidyltransferase with HDIG domain